METTTATTIDDDSDDLTATKATLTATEMTATVTMATMTRPQQRDHGDETMTSRYNQLNGGPSAVER